MKIIENAKVEDLQEGDVIDLHGLVFGEINGDDIFVLTNTGSGWVDKKVFNSLTIHRKDPADQALEDAQKAITALNALGGDIEYTLSPVAKIEPYTPEPEPEFKVGDKVVMMVDRLFKFREGDKGVVTDVYKEAIQVEFDKLLICGTTCVVNKSDAQLIKQEENPLPPKLEGFGDWVAVDYEDEGCPPEILGKKIIALLKYEDKPSEFRSEITASKDDAGCFKRCSGKYRAYAIKQNPFIDWHGGECPVDGDVKAEIKRRDENAPLKDCMVIESGRCGTLYDWSHPHCEGSQYDIIAYRIID